MNTKKGLNNKNNLICVLITFILCFSCVSGLFANGNGNTTTDDPILPLLGMWKMKIVGLTHGENVNGEIGFIRTEEGIYFRGEGNLSKYYLYGTGTLKDKTLTLEFYVQKREEYATSYQTILKGKAELTVSGDSKHVEGTFYNVGLIPAPTPKNQQDSKGLLTMDKIYIPVEILKSVR